MEMYRRRGIVRRAEEITRHCGAQGQSAPSIRRFINALNSGGYARLRASTHMSALTESARSAAGAVK
ncbi:MAG: hypothetical protein PWQ29_1710 [Verrucomicrobiota bacterium]|nr:hypothetical protein [Verrucomicrobiota bacterium]MDK2964316.1 hypothetical protein [Verrucomicrobiota bacterium]